jgi:hypothetical protein
MAEVVALGWLRYLRLGAWAIIEDGDADGGDVDDTSTNNSSRISTVTTGAADAAASDAKEAPLVCNERVKMVCPALSLRPSLVTKGEVLLLPPPGRLFVD